MPRSLRTAPELFIATLFVTAVLGTVDAAAAPLEVTVGDVRSTDGVLLIQITDSAEGFDDGRPPVASLVFAPAVSSVTFSVDLEPGVYGMRVMQDLDDDGEMDTNFMGIPTEPWAFSNNAVGNFGPPAWGSIQFEMTTAAAVQNVSLVH